MEAYFQLWPKWEPDKALPKDTLDAPKNLHLDVPTEDFLLYKKDFHCLFPTMVLFVEQEPYTSVPMHLDVNFCQISQENYNNNDVSTFRREMLRTVEDSF